MFKFLKAWFDAAALMVAGFAAAAYFVLTGPLVYNLHVAGLFEAYMAIGILLFVAATMTGMMLMAVAAPHLSRR